MKRAYRVPVSRWLDDKNFAEHIQNVRENVDVIDEVSLFVEYSHHGYVELSEVADICAVCEKRLAAYREAGVKRVGINTLCTIGHLDEAWDYMAKLPMQGYKGRDGRVSKSCMCPSSDLFRQYIVEKYRLVAAAKPDFIWIDDDIRIGNHGVADGCYCDKCIADFNGAYGLSETFESLTANVQKETEVKKQWDSFREKLYTDLCALLARTIKEADAEIEIGAMCSSVFRKEWVAAQEATMLRPGGGFYCDDNHVEMIKKAIDTGKQIVKFSNGIEDIQYEFEDFPYKRYDKSKHMTAMESSLALMNGCTGVVYNFMGKTEYPEFYGIIRQNAKYWDRMTELCASKKNAGFYSENMNDTLQLTELGFTAAHGIEDAQTVILDGALARRLTKNELKSVLSRGVYVNAAAVRYLCDIGFGEYVGCKAQYCNDNGLMEKFTDHKLNREAEGYIRDPFINFYGSVPVMSLVPTHDGCECVAKLITIHGDEVGNAMLAYENSLGGRVVSASFFETSSLRFLEKHKQLLNVFDWLSYGRPVLKADYAGKLYPVLRKDGEGGFVLMLYNPSYDETGKFALTLSDVRSADVYALTEDGGDEELSHTFSDAKLTVNVPSIKPFGALVIHNG